MGRVALIGENSVEYVNILLDIWNSGDCAVLLDWRIPPISAIEIMREADVHCCYIEESFYYNFDISLCKEFSFKVFKNQTKSATILPEKLYHSFRADYRKEEAIVLYSSGTTGKSKGVILSHFAIQTNADAIIDYMHPTAEDCIGIVKTLSHSSTLVGELLVALKTGMKILIGPVITLPRVTLSHLSKFGTTILCVNPTLLKLYADEVAKNEYNLNALKVIYVSGAVLNDSIYDYARRVFLGKQILNVYGLSEAGPRVTSQKANGSQSNSVGTPIKGVQVAIIDDKGFLVSNSQCGNIHVKSPSIFDGYIKGTIKHSSKYKEWLNTGDIGFWDESGELHVVGRGDDVINIDAHKIYPHDIEAAIYKTATIKECVVTAVEYGNAQVLFCAYVSETDIAVDIKKKLSESLLRYEIPQHFVKLTELPKTRTGKTLVRDVQMMLKKMIEKNEKDNG